MWARLLERPDRPIRTTQLAALVGCTREHLSREFGAGGAPNLKRVIDLTRVMCAASLLTNLMGGHVDVGIVYSDDMVRMRDQLHVLAVATKEKFPGREDVPTFKEQGFDYDAGVSRGIAHPAGAPDYALKKLEKAFVDITNSPEVTAQMTREGFVSRALNAEQFAAEIARQKKFWGDALKDADIKKK